MDKESYGIWLTLSSFISWFSFFDIGLGNGLRTKFTEAKANGKYKLAKIYIVGHGGLVSSAIIKNLEAGGYTNFIIRTHKELDLTNSTAVADFFATEKPEYVVLAAAKVGDIVANNTYRADLIYANLMNQNNVIHQSYVHDVKY